MLADSPTENGVLNSRTLLHPASATQRFPEESKVSPPMPPAKSLSALAEGIELSEPVVKFSRPITILAFSLFVKGALNSSTRSFKPSTTQRFPEESNVSPDGLLRHDGLTLVVPEQTSVEVVKLGLPKTMLALSPVVSGLLNSS